MQPRPPAAAPKAPSWKSVAIPVEHGGWGLLIEPLALGLVLAPSPAGIALAGASAAAFLVRHPLRLAMMDRRRGSRYPRTALAERVAAAFAAVALACVLAALALARAAFWPPLAAAAPFALAALAYDLRGRSRELLPEAAGAVALGASATAIALAGGVAAGVAWGGWLLLALRAVASVLYVRARIRLDRGLAASPAGALVVHALALAASVALAVLAWAPRLAVVAFAVLLARATWGLSSRRRVVRPQTLGFQELRYGILTLLLLALGYRIAA